MNDDFYIGWEDKAPASYGRLTRRLVAVVLALTLLAALGFAASQRLIGTAFFEWGDVKEFTGVLRATPYPHLVLDGSRSNTASAAITAPLVAPFKFGVTCEAICGFDGQRVNLRATRIHRDDQLMLEVEPNSVKLADGMGATNEARRIVSLGHHTFRGEIVDSKCWMGVMNPGVLATHRACAVRCISGGIPPMLLVRRANDRPLNLLLVSTNDQPVNAAVLDFITEPVSVAGEVVRRGALLMLRIDPATIRRL